MAAVRRLPVHQICVRLPCPAWTSPPRPGPPTSPSRCRAFMAEEVEPVEPQYHRDLAAARENGTQWTPLPVIEDLKAKARDPGAVEPLPAEGARRPGDQPVRREVRHRRRRGAVERRLRTAGRADGSLGHRADRVQLQRTRHRQHGGAAALRLRATQRKEWLEPLLDGRIRSAFAMTEPGVASSDATNMEATCVVDGDEMVVNGHKWWTTGVGHPDCKDLRVHGRHRPRRRPAPAPLDGARPAGRARA